MTSGKPEVSSYRKLVTEIACLYEGARKALVEAYWKIGQRIVLVEQQGAVKAVYGTGLIPKLSEDLTRQLGPGFSIRQLTDMRRFYLMNKIRRPAAELSWTQHIELLKIGNVKKRKALEVQAIRESLKRDEIREIVQAELVRAKVAENLVRSEDEVPYGSPDRQLLEPVRGTLYTYRIVQPKLVGETESELLVDLGFSSYWDLDNVSSKKFVPGDIVSSAKDPDGNYKLSAASVKPASLFTYRAEVEKVVDGDTLRVVVDLGFGFKTRQYLRLRGLDCPEMDTPEGKKASDFVKARIKQADEVILTSSRSDKYDRYLADVFYTDSEGNEQYLNNQILEQGLAVRMGE